MATVRIIAAFPGTGKTYLSNIDPKKYIDMECSAFAKARQISIYTAAIIKTTNSLVNANKANDKKFFILISTHAEVRNRLKKEGYTVELFYPNRILKYEYIHRYRQRGSNGKAISYISANWHKLIDNMRLDKTFPRQQLETGQYLSDLI